MPWWRAERALAYEVREKDGDDEHFKVIENVNWKMINMGRNMRRKTK